MAQGSKRAVCADGWYCGRDIAGSMLAWYEEVGRRPLGLVADGEDSGWFLVCYFGEPFTGWHREMWEEAHDLVMAGRLRLECAACVRRAA